MHYLIKLYGQPLLRYCHNILCDYHEAQDAVQTTFIKAYNKRKSFEEGRSLSAWLYRIAYTTCIDMLRKKKILFFILTSNVPNLPQHQNKGIGSKLIIESLKTAKKLGFKSVIVLGHDNILRVFCHADPKLILPLGCTMRLNPKMNECTLLESPFE